VTSASSFRSSGSATPSPVPLKRQISRCLLAHTCGPALNTWYGAAGGHCNAVALDEVVQLEGTLRTGHMPSQLAEAVNGESAINEGKASCAQAKDLYDFIELHVILLQAAIANAATLDEVAQLEDALRTGHMPSQLAEVVNGGTAMDES